MNNYNLMGIAIGNRKTFAPDVQEVLTRYGKIIKMRIGLHETLEDENNNEGFIILTLNNDDNKINALSEELEAIDTVRVKNIKL